MYIVFILSTLDLGLMDTQLHHSSEPHSPVDRAIPNTLEGYQLSSVPISQPVAPSMTQYCDTRVPYIPSTTSDTVDAPFPGSSATESALHAQINHSRYIVWYTIMHMQPWSLVLHS